MEQKDSEFVRDPTSWREKLINQGEELIDEIDGLDNSEAVGLLSRPQMEKFREMPHVYRQPDKNMRGIGLLDMACAIEHQRKNRASAELACHVTEVLEGLQTEGTAMTMQTSCERPKPIPIGLDVGELD